MSNNKRQVSDGLTVEQVAHLYFNEVAVTPPAYKLFRAHVGNKRYYFNPDDPEARLYPGITTVIRKGFPQSYGLEQWKMQQAMTHGYANAGKDYAMNRARFGTMLHILAADFFANSPVDLDGLGDRYTHLIHDESGMDFARSEQEAQDNLPELKRAFLAFLQWTIDMEVEPLFVECLLKSDTHGYASAVDLGCELSLPLNGYWGEVYKSGANKGKPKQSKKKARIRCIVDFKSGAGLYEEHQIQGTGYRELVFENMPDFFPFEPYKDEEGNVVMEAQPFFIWRPKDWKTRPDYHCTYQEPHGSWPAVRDIGIASAARTGEEQEVNVSGVAVRQGFDQSKLDALLSVDRAEVRLSEDRKKGQAPNHLIDEPPL